MSHFSVLVIGPNVDGQLAPYEESPAKNSGFLEFKDMQEEYAREWESNKKTIKEFYPGHHIMNGEGPVNELLKNGRLIIKDCREILFLTAPGEIVEFIGIKREDFKESGEWEKAVRRAKSVWAKIYAFSENKLEPGEGRSYDITFEKIAPPKVWRIQERIQEHYKDFETFCADYHESKPDIDTGRRGYWYNPNAKWDWYKMGGRWTGYFKLTPQIIKDKTIWPKHKVGKPGLQTEKPQEGYADQAFKKDIDFEGIRKEATERAEKNWDEAMTKDDGERAVIYGIEKGMAKEQYINRHSKFNTFAVLKGGKWYERGKMGWWGCVHDEKPDNKWDEEFEKLIADLPESVLLTICDCHI